MSVVVATYLSKCPITETIAPPTGAHGAISLTRDLLDTEVRLTSDSTVPVTKQYQATVALVSGAKTLDLTSLSDGVFAAITLLGLKIQVLKIRATSTNTDPIAFTEGASNGYSLLGASWLVALKPGQEVLIYGNDATPDVASGDKTIDCAGTAAETFDILIVAG